MKVIIAGSRSISNIIHIDYAVEESEFEITEVVCGGANGADRLGEVWANLRNIPGKRFNANWAAQGKSAGFLRNGKMAEYADALIAVWDGKSRGTADMIDRMRRLGKPTFVYLPNLAEESGTVLAQSDSKTSNPLE